MNYDYSIYIPAYNAENTIIHCLNSIINQKIKPNEILVINDGSTDNTLNKLSNFEKNIKIINNQENLGLSKSMNIANQNLTSRFIAKIDADVELDPLWSKLMLEKMQTNKITLIGGKMYEKYIENPYNFWRSIRLKQNWGEKDIDNPPFIFGCNNIIDKKNLSKKNLYRTDLEYFKTNGEDIEISKYLKKNNHSLYYLSSATCFHLQNDNQFSLSKRYWRYIHYGDGLKKRSLFKTMKNILRQVKKTLKWSILDIINFNFKLIFVNFKILYQFSIIDFKYYKKTFIK